MVRIDDNIATFIKGIGEIPLLSAEKEIELATVIRDYFHSHPDELPVYKVQKSKKSAKVKASTTREYAAVDAAVETFAKSNLRLVVKEAFKVSNRTGFDVKDLIGHGCQGLMRAIYKFDPTLSIRFSTYATFWIQQGMREFMHHNSSPVHIPIHILGGLSKSRKLNASSENKKSDADIMRELKINESFLNRIKKADVSSVSLDSTADDADDNTRSLEEVIADENAVNPSEATENADRYEELYAAMSELDEMSRDIIFAQFLEKDKVQLNKLGEKYGLTGERIRQLKVKALSKLRKKIIRRSKTDK